MFKLILLCLFLIGSVAPDIYNQRNPERQHFLEELSATIYDVFEEEYRNFDPDQPKSEGFTEVMDLLKVPISAARDEIEDVIAPQQGAICILCRSIFTVLIDKRRQGANDDEMRSLAVDLCVNLELYTANVCTGVVSMNLPVFTFIIDNMPQLTSRTMCSMILQGSNCISNDQSMDWTINVAGGGQPITQPKSQIPQQSADDLVIIHITDNHPDPNYREYHNMDCGEPTCCRERQGIPTDVSKRAGRWGNYQCNTPFEQFEDVLRRIRSAHPRVDAIYFTGDVTDHGIWETTFMGNLQSMMRTNDLMEQILPGVPIFPVLGNHESHPTNLFAPAYLNRPDLSTQWLYDFVADEWRDWLDAGAEQTIKRAGYYTTVMRPGFRIVALNNNDCYTYNWWLMYDHRYPIPQLQWFQDTLNAAEYNNEKVHVLAHMPSGGGSCFRVWAREFRRIVDRYWNTIGGIFNGHTHRDQFNVYYSRANPNYAINVAWNGGSTTTFTNVNPNYRLYHVEKQSYQVTDSETYIYNLTLANINRNQNPSWFKEYTFKEQYGLPDLSPASLNNLLNRMATQPSLISTFWSLSHKLSDALLPGGCDNNCLAQLLCRMAVTEHGENTRCNQLLSTFWATVGQEGPL